MRSSKYDNVVRSDENARSGHQHGIPGINEEVNFRNILKNHSKKSNILK